MESVLDLFAWFATGKGRYAAAALLFLTMQSFKNLPVMREWLAKDSGWLLGIRWTTKRKKALATALHALAPVVPMLGSNMPIGQVLVAAGEILAGAAGLKMLWNVVRKQPDKQESEDGDADAQ